MAINTYCDTFATPTENCDPISFFAAISTNLFRTVPLPFLNALSSISFWMLFLNDLFYSMNIQGMGQACHI